MFRLKRKTSADDIVNLVNNKLDKVFENTTNKLNSNFEIMSENGKLKDKINRLEQDLQDQIAEFKLKLKDKDNLIEKQSLELISVKKEKTLLERKYSNLVDKIMKKAEKLSVKDDEILEKLDYFRANHWLVKSEKEGKIPKGQAIGSKSPVQSASRSRIIKEVTK